MLSLPAVAALKRWLGTRPLGVATPKKLSALWHLCPFVDRVIEIDQPKSLWRTVSRLRKEEFAAALLLPNSTRSALEVWLAGIRKSWGKAGSARSALLSRPLLCGDPGERQPRQAAAYLALAEEIGAAGSLSLPELRIPSSWAGPSEPGIAVCPGAEFGPAKRWPVDSYVVLARRLREATGYRIRLYGAAGDREVCRRIAAAVPGVESFAGETTLEEFLSALARSRLVVCNDSGAMHAAALLGRPTVALFGSTDPARTGPLGHSTRVLVHPVPCGPCFLRTCPRDMACLREIEPEAVVSACLQQLALSVPLSS